MFRKVTTYTALLLTLVLVGCAAEDGPDVASFDGPEDTTFVTADRTGQPHAQAVAQAPLLLEEAALSRELDQIMGKGVDRCNHLDCQVDVRSFDYISTDGIAPIEDVVESVRMRYLDQMPLENEGRSYWKLFEGDLARLEMSALVDASADAMETPDLEIGRATAVYFPKNDVQAFATIYVLHAPNTGRVITVRIVELNISER